MSYYWVTLLQASWREVPFPRRRFKCRLWLASSAASLTMALWQLWHDNMRPASTWFYILQYMMHSRESLFQRISLAELHGWKVQLPFPTESKTVTCWGTSTIQVDFGIGCNSWYGSCNISDRSLNWQAGRLKLTERPFPKTTINLTIPELKSNLKKHPHCWRKVKWTK